MSQIITKLFYKITKLFYIITRFLGKVFDTSPNRSEPP